MNAVEAKIITENIKTLRKLKEDVKTLPRSLETIWKLIIWAIEDGKTSCSIPYLPANVKFALNISKFTVKYEKDEHGAPIYTVLWDKEIKENDDKGRNTKWENDSRRGTSSRYGFVGY